MSASASRRTRQKNTNAAKSSQLMMALEPRIMFDAAAAVVIDHAAAEHQAAQQAAEAERAPTPAEQNAPSVDQADSDLGTPSLFIVPESSPANLQAAQQAAQTAILDYIARTDAQTLFEIFSGQQTEASPEWLAFAENLRQQILDGQYSVEVQRLGNDEMSGTYAAFAAVGPAGQAVIFINRDWLAAQTDTEIVTAVLVEELGHSIDHALNPNSDSAGDEGEIFAHAVIDGTHPQSALQFASQNDHATLLIDGQTVKVELASLNFVNAYAMVYDLNNNGAIDVNERWADKEQNSHYFNTQGLSVAFIDDDTGSNLFSGNDVSAIGISIGGQEYFGWISRPIKANGLVRGFYFWTDDTFTNLATAQADGNMDGDRIVTDNKGFLLVVDQAWFNTQIASPASYTINNAKDGNLGPISVANVGSSSDRVDAALNSLLTPNSAPTPANDVLVVAEDSGTSTGNILTNDTDPDLDPLSITGFTVDGSSGTLGTAKTISGVGSFTLSANGDYSFTPAANYNGPVPPITCTVSDGKGGSATAVLSISVTPVNDLPVSTNDALTVNPNSSVFLSLSDFGTYSDVDGDPLAKIVITSLPATGRLEYHNGTSWVAVTANQEFTAAAINAGKLRLTAGTVDTAIGFKVSDGTATSIDTYTLSITVPAAPANPTANADTGTGAAYEPTEGVNGVAGTPASGNVLTNDTGSSIKVTSVFNTAVAASGNTTIKGAYGTLTISADGSYSYAPDNSNATVDALNVGGSVTEAFSYTVTDSNGNTATSTLTVKINGANDAPVARDDANSLKELAAINNGNYGTVTGNVLPNDSDVDNSTGLKVVLDGTTPPGSSDLSFSVSSPISAVTLAITQVSGSWTAIVSNSVQTAVWLNSTGTSIATDRNGNPLTVIRTGSGGGASLVFSDNVALYGYQNTNLYIKDAGNSNIATITVAITSATTSSSSIVSTTSADINNIAVGYSVSGTGVPGGTTVTAINASTKEITLSNAVSIANTSLTFHDPNGVSISATQTYKAGTHGYLILDESGSYTYTLTSNTLTAGQSYTETFIYKTTDGSAQSNTATLRITIDGTSGAYTISAVNDNLTVTEDTPGTVNVLTNDTSTTTVTGYSWGDQSTTSAGTELTLGGVGRLTITSGGLLTFTPATNYNGSVPSVIYTASAGGAEQVSATVTLSITPANDAPTSTNDAITIPKNTPAILTLGDFGTFSDIDGDAFAGVKITTLESAGTLEFYNGTTWTDVTLNQEITAADITAGKLRYTPVSNAVGNNHATIGFEVSDGTSYSASAYTLTVNVTDPTAVSADSPPVNTVPGAQTVNDYETIAFSGLSVADHDTDVTSTTLIVANGSLAVTGSGATGTGTANSPLVLTGTQAEINTLLASLVYTPTVGFSGADTLRMHTVDSVGNSDTDFIDITVNADSRALTVTGTTVNEASPNVLFRVAGLAGQRVTFELATTGTGTGHATSGADYLPNLEYFNGTAWVAYTDGLVTIPSGDNLLVRTAVLQDTLNEGAETLKLIAKNTAGTAYDGNSTIKDDGTGSIYLTGNNTSTADTSGTGFPAYLDDDRSISVNSIVVNEASPYAVFTVTGQTGQIVRLALNSGTATVGTDTGNTLQVNYGSGWVDYTANSDLTLTGTTLLVRTTITQDANFEGQEAIYLAVTKQSSGTSVYGTGNIYDDGTGKIYQSTNTTGTPDGDGTDDDRTLAINSPTVNEASNIAIFTLTGNSGQTVSLQLLNDSSNGTITGKANVNTTLPLKIWDGLDWVNYNATSLPTFDASGKIFVSVNIQAEQDAPYEGSETFRLQTTLTGSSQTAEGTGTIIDNGTGVKYDGTFTTGIPTTVNTALDNDTPAAKSLTYSATSFVEAVANDGSITTTSTITLSNDTFNGVDGAALGTITNVPAGLTAVLVKTSATTATLSLTGNATAHANAQDIANLTVSFVNSDFTGNNAGSVTNATKNDLVVDFADPAPSLSINDVTVNEAAGTATFTVTRSGATGATAAVDYATGNGTATAGADYSTTSGTLSFAAGDTTKTFTVDITNDAIFEGSETLNITLSNVSGATISDGTGVGTIKDDGTGNSSNGGSGTGTDNDTPTLSVSSPSVAEGSPAVFTVSLCNASTQAISFTPSLSNASATVGTDTAAANTLEVSTNGGTSWNTVTGAVTIAAGQTSVQLRIATTDDALAESNETFTLSTGAITGTVTNTTPATGNATITDNDVAPTLSINDVTVNEAAGTATFTVTRSGATGATAAVDYATGNGTATAGADYSTTSGTLSFAAGDTTKTFTVDITNDAIFEGSETLNITLSNVSGATISDGTGVGTIKDDGTGNSSNGGSGTGTDNDTPTLSVSSPSVAEGCPVVFTVSLSNASTQAISFTPSLSNASATIGTDTAAANTLEVSTDGGNNWNTVTGAVTITAGQTSVQLRIATTDDAIAETDETFTLSTGAITGTVTNTTPATGNATITDNDEAPSLSINDVIVNEAAGTATFTVTRSGATGAAASVDYATGNGNGNGTATAGADYTSKTGTLNFAAGDTTKTFTVDITNDAIFEGSETLNITLFNATGATLTDGTGVGTIKDDGTGTGGNDDDRPVTVTSPTVNEASTYAVFTVTGSIGQSIGLILSGGTATGSGTDFGGSLQVSTDGGTTWTNYNSAVTVPAGGSFLVRTPVIEDTIQDNGETFTLTATPAGGVAAIGTATINDDGNGTVFNPNGSVNTTTTKSDDRPIIIPTPAPVPVIAPTPAPIPQPAPLPAPPVVQPEPVILVEPPREPNIPFELPNLPTMPSIDSALVLQDGDSSNQAGQLFVNVQPSSQVVEAGRATTVQLPSGVFKNSDSSARTSVEATLADGQPLPEWLNFNKATSQFSGKPPAGATGTFDIKLVAKDDRGNAASTEFVLRVADSSTQANANAGTPTANPASGALQFAATAQESGPALNNNPAGTAEVQPLTFLVVRGGGNENLSAGLHLVIAPAEQTAVAGRESVFQLPAGTFLHTDSDAAISIEAKMADGQPLPSWLSFDPETGKFSGTPPAGSEGVLTLRIIARDEEGREVSTEFRISVNALEGAPPGKVAQEEEVTPEAEEEGEENTKDAKPNKVATTEQSPNKQLQLPRGRANLSDQLARHGRQGMERERVELQQHLQRLAEQRAAKEAA